MGLKQKILAFLSSEEPKVLLSETSKLENGTVLISEEFKEGMPIFIKSEDEDGENVKLPIGEYQMEDGKILKVQVEGEIASIQEAKIEAEEPQEEVKEEEVVMEEEAELKEEETKMDEVVYDEAHMEAMHQAIASLEARIAALEPQQEQLQEEVVEMSAEEPKEEVVVEAQEEVAPIAHSPEASDEKRVRFYFPQN
jgi:hypothetical protein